MTHAELAGGTRPRRECAVVTPAEDAAWDRARAFGRLHHLYAYRVNKMFRLFHCRHVCEHDLFSVGRFAAYRYALKAGADFAPAVANIAARRAMLRELDAVAGHPGSAKRAGLAATIPLDDAPEDDPAFRTLDPVPDMDAGIYSPAVKLALAELPPRERYVVVSHAVDGLTFEAIGKTIGVTKERVRQIEMRGLMRLREALAPPAVPVPTPVAPVVAPARGPVARVVSAAARSAAIAARLDALERRAFDAATDRHTLYRDARYGEAGVPTVSPAPPAG